MFGRDGAKHQHREGWQRLHAISTAANLVAKVASLPESTLKASMLQNLAEDIKCAVCNLL